MATTITLNRAQSFQGTDTFPSTLGASEVFDGEIHVRGVPIGDLIGRMTFTEMLFFQLQSRPPTSTEAAMMESYLVSLCEHGVTSPSTHGARVAANVDAPFPASAISFLCGAMGGYHFGALERSMLQIREIVAGDIDLATFVDEQTRQGARVWGFGHRFHKSADSDKDQDDAAERFHERADPRVRRLLEIADELDWNGVHLQAVREIGRLLFKRKRVPINIDGLAAGLLLDMGFEPEIALLFVVLGRLPNIARLHEEERKNIPNRFVGLADRSAPTFDRTVEREQR